MKKTMLVLSLMALVVMFSSFAMAEEVAKCVQLPICCNSNSDCTCSGCCANFPGPGGVLIHVNLRAIEIPTPNSFSIKKAI
jgi:hypothetical protein